MEHLTREERVAFLELELKKANSLKNQALAKAQEYLKAGPHHPRYRSSISESNLYAKKEKEINQELQYLKDIIDSEQKIYEENKIEKVNKSEFQYDSENLIDQIEMCYLKKYNMISYSWKKLKIVPTMIKALNWINELNLSSNELTTLPNELSELVNVRRLVLSDNKLKSIDFGIEKMTNIVVLKLAGNSLIELPETMGTLTKLEVLDLERNFLRSVPVCIGEFTRLSSLWLSSTKITLLPPAVGTLTNLTSLRFNDTPMKMIPVDIYYKGLEEVLKFLRSYIPDTSEGSIGVSVLSKEITQLFVKNEFTDTTFVLEDGKVSSHRCILSVRCPSILTSYSKIGDSPNEFFVNSVKLDVFKALLMYIYSDSENIPTPTRDTFYVELMSLAQFLNIERLYQICDMYKQKNTVISELLAPGKMIEEISQLWKDPHSNSDIEFEIGELTIKSHKAILASRCQYFYSMFTSGLKEANSKKVPLNDVRYEILTAILEYLYTDDVADINSDIAMDLLICSHQYGITRLKRLMENLLGYSIDVDSVSCVLDVAALYQCKTLARACFFFIIKEYQSVCRTDTWNEMSEAARKIVSKHGPQWGLNPKWKEK